MKKRIEIDFEEEITNEHVLYAIERAFRQAVEAVAECAKIRKVTVDGNVKRILASRSSSKEENGTAEKAVKKEYPLHHEPPVVHRVP